MSMAFCFWRKGCRWRLVTAGPDPRVPYTQTPTKGRLRALKKNRIDFYVCLTQMRMTSYLADLNFRLCGYFNRMIDEASLPLMTIPLSERMFGWEKDAMISASWSKSSWAAGPAAALRTLTATASSSNWRAGSGRRKDPRKTLPKQPSPISCFSSIQSGRMMTNGLNWSLGCKSWVVSLPVDPRSVPSAFQSYSGLLVNLSCCSTFFVRQTGISPMPGLPDDEASLVSTMTLDAARRDFLLSLRRLSQMMPVSSMAMATAGTNHVMTVVVSDEYSSLSSAGKV